MRNGGVDLLRFVGAAGIILFHCGAPLGWLGLSALPMFVMLLVYFGAGRPTARHLRRLMSPWAIWSVVYAVMKIGQSVVDGTPLSAEFEPWMLLTGTSLHLWFLPFSFLFLVVSSALFASISLSVLWGAAVAASLLSYWAFVAFDLPIPLVQWATVVPAAFAGLLMQRSRSPAVPAAVLGGACFLAVALGFERMNLQLAIAGLAVALVMAIRLPQTKATDFMSNVSFGMYLVHPAAIAFALYVFPAGSWETFIAVMIGSFIATVVLRRIVPAAV